jgi:cellulase/cellobiase CelA1
LADVTGQPIDLDRFAEDLKPLTLKAGVQAVTYDPHTDKHLARYWPDAKPITGQDFANASERFVRAVETGQLRYQSAEAVTNDLLYVSRKATTGSSFIADRADPRRPITAALAAIRAVWPAAAPYQGPPTIYTA